MLTISYRLYKASPTTKFPTVICIFSAPNYCDAYNNKGAIIRFQNNLMNIRQFNYSPHPYYLPNFMNAFNWSLPFVVEKVMDIFQTILNLCDPAEDAQEEEVEPVDNNAPLDKERAQAIKLKIRTVGRLCRMYTTLREEHESIVMLKGLAGGQIPQGLLQQGNYATHLITLVLQVHKPSNLLFWTLTQPSKLTSKMKRDHKSKLPKMPSFPNLWMPRKRKSFCKR